MVGVPYRLTILRTELICPGDRCQSKACSKQWRRVFQSITTNFRYEGKIYAAEGEQVDRTLFEPAVKSTGETAAVWDISEVVGSSGKVTLSATLPGGPLIHDSPNEGCAHFTVPGGVELLDLGIVLS